jgi:hypothetical protein
MQFVLQKRLINASLETRKPRHYQNGTDAARVALFERKRRAASIEIQRSIARRSLKDSTELEERLRLLSRCRSNYWR